MTCIPPVGDGCSFLEALIRCLAEGCPCDGDDRSPRSTRGDEAPLLEEQRRQAHRDDGAEREQEIDRRMGDEGVLHVEILEPDSGCHPHERIRELVQCGTRVLRVTQELSPNAHTIVDVFTSAGWQYLLAHRHYAADPHESPSPELLAQIRTQALQRVTSAEALAPRW